VSVHREARRRLIGFAVGDESVGGDLYGEPKRAGGRHRGPPVARTAATVKSALPRGGAGGLAGLGGSGKKGDGSGHA
jgi:hypothetical protein